MYEAMLPSVETIERAAVLANLGPLFCLVGRETDGERVLTEGIELLFAQPQQEPLTVAAAANSLGNLYLSRGQPEKARSVYENVLACYKSYARIQPTLFRWHIAVAQNQIASAYTDQGLLKEAVDTYLESFVSFNRLANENPNKYAPDAARAYVNLASVLGKIGQFERAEDLCKRALAIYNSLARPNPEAYLPDVARVFSHLGHLYASWGKSTAAEEAYREAAVLLESLAKEQPLTYGSQLGGLLISLGNLARQEKPQLSEDAYLRARSIFTYLADSNPKYQEQVAGCGINLSVLYLEQNRTSDAEAACFAADEALEPLWKAYPDSQADNKARLLLIRAKVMSTSDPNQARAFLSAGSSIARLPSLRDDIQKCMASTAPAGV